MRKTIWKLSMIGATALAGLQPAQAEVRYQAQTEKAVAGEVLELGAAFFAQSDRPGNVEVSIRLPELKVVQAVVDYDNRHFSVRSFWEADEAPAEVTGVDNWVAAALLTQLSPSHSEVEATLEHTLNLLTEAPPGLILAIDRDFDDEPQKGTKTITSLCASTGKRVKATYTTETRTLSETLLVGPCYNAKNECIGRCGIGCGVLGSGLSQQFTQDCLNHDLCRLRTGANVTAPCDDEFVSASDDFFVAADCAEFSGTWKDNYKFKWTVTQDANGILDGTVQTVRCGSYSVSGIHSDGKIQGLEASRFFPPSGCCRSFTYTGTYKTCSAVGGTWKNACRGKGKFAISRAKALSASIEGETKEDLLDPTADGGTDPFE